jgi:hypothetical protein
MNLILPYAVPFCNSWRCEVTPPPGFHFGALEFWCNQEDPNDRGTFVLRLLMNAEANEEFREKYGAYHQGWYGSVDGATVLDPPSLRKALSFIAEKLVPMAQSWAVMDVTENLSTLLDSRK